VLTDESAYTYQVRRFRYPHFVALSSYFLHLYTTQIDDGAPVCFDGYVRDDKDARATCMRLAKARCFCCWQEAARFEMMVLWHGVGEEGEREERGGEQKRRKIFVVVHVTVEAHRSTVVNLGGV